jgi:hypothetical protein
MSLKLNSSGGGSVTLQEPSTANNQTLTLPDNTGTLISTASTFAGNGPAFSAYATVNQTISGSTNTKVTFGSEDFDTNGNFASSRFTPTVAGYYQINATINFTNSGNYGYVMLWKNGAAYKTVAYSILNSSFYTTVSGSSVVYLNGSTDYLEVYVLVGLTINIVPNAGAGENAVNFSGALVRAA